MEGEFSVCMNRMTFTDVLGADGSDPWLLPVEY